MPHKILVADIGGTKVKIALVEIAGPTWSFKNQEEFLSHNYKSLEEIISFYLKKQVTSLLAIALGVAGPVNNGESHITNLPWTIKVKDIKKALDIKNVFLLNDLEAHAHGVSSLAPNDFITIQKGHPTSGNAAIMAVGTGLGECVLFWDGKKHIPCPSEGGHTDFGPQSPETADLLQFLFRKYSHVSWERVLSGCFGFLNLYSFLRDQHKMAPSKNVEAALKKEDPNIGPVIVEDAQHGSLISKKCLEMFVSFYGAEAGNLALKSFAVHGIYLSGGIAPKILSYLKTDLFLHSFSKKGRQSDLLKQIPIHVITDPDLPLKGLVNFVRCHLTADC